MCVLCARDQQRTTRRMYRNGSLYRCFKFHWFWQSPIFLDFSSLRIFHFDKFFFSFSNWASSLTLENRNESKTCNDRSAQHSNRALDRCSLYVRRQYFHQHDSSIKPTVIYTWHILQWEGISMYSVRLAVPKRNETKKEKKRKKNEILYNEQINENIILMENTAYFLQCTWNLQHAYTLAKPTSKCSHSQAIANGFTLRSSPSKSHWRIPLHSWNGWPCACATPLWLRYSPQISATTRWQRIRSS